MGLSQGYLVTAGTALTCIEFSTAAQPQARFRYLGNEMLGSRETCVLAFLSALAKLPSQPLWREPAGKKPIC